MKLYMLSINKADAATFFTTSANSILEARATAYRATGNVAWMSAKKSTCEVIKTANGKVL